MQHFLETTFFPVKKTYTRFMWNGWYENDNEMIKRIKNSIPPQLGHTSVKKIISAFTHSHLAAQKKFAKS